MVTVVGTTIVLFSSPPLLGVHILIPQGPDVLAAVLGGFFRPPVFFGAKPLGRPAPVYLGQPLLDHLQVGVFGTKPRKGAFQSHAVFQTASIALYKELPHFPSTLRVLLSQVTI